MQASRQAWTTGLKGLDASLRGILDGDNIVWQVPSIREYASLVRPAALAGARAGRRVLYYRFAHHAPLLSRTDGVEEINLCPGDGFESFIARIHGVAAAAGRGVLHVFDGLSELAADWYSDQMLGNFFMLTCPFLYRLDTVAYFGLLRDQHSYRALDPILATTQLFIEVYVSRQNLYMRPLKVRRRPSSGMDMLRVRLEDGDSKPVTFSGEVAHVLDESDWSGIGSRRAPGFRERALREAREILRNGNREERRDMRRRLCRMHVSRDERMLALVERYLDLPDVMDIGKRMVGSGLIGGKAVGMLLARAILRQQRPRLADLLEKHDSFYVGSDVFYTFLVQNDVWWAKGRQRDPDRYLEGAAEARARIRNGFFADYILKQFEEMLDYFGRAPFIVRSSSLLEDNFGNAFAGKYESVFCANQGSREQRLEAFLDAVRKVYASAMSEAALRYRARRGIIDRDEQMALLVMRVSGRRHGRYFFPSLAGVGFSFNPYVWSEWIDPRAGVLRLVFGLGTRAVERSDDDYTRVVALNAPCRRPETEFDDIFRHAQRRMDMLDLEEGCLAGGEVREVIKGTEGLPLDLLFENAPHSGTRGPAALTFQGLLARTPVVKDLRELLGLLEEAYGCPVDIEFTVNFVDGKTCLFNLVQCRPLQVRSSSLSSASDAAEQEEPFLSARGAVIGCSRALSFRYLVQVVTEVYAGLPLRDRYETARWIGEINRILPDAENEGLVVMGPGRWGTRDPSLGIPVSFADINRVSVLIELAEMSGTVMPDASLGTHFLSDLIETDMLYAALFPGEGDYYLDETFLASLPNRLADLVPAAASHAGLLRVLDSRCCMPDGAPFSLVADALKQRLVCRRRPPIPCG